MTKDDEMVSVLAFYGIKKLNCDELRGLVEVTKDWFKRNQLPIDRMGLGYGKWSKVTSFKNGFRQLEERGFDQLHGFEMYSIMPGGKNQVADPNASVSFSQQEFFFFERQESRLLGDIAQLTDPINKAIRLLDPEYGIGYSRPWRLGPGCYAIGLCQGLPLDREGLEEGDNISLWGREGMVGRRVYRDGVLRDVYPLNYLTGLQLDIPLGEASLRAWIETDASHGILRALTAELSVWTLQEEQIPAVREFLRAKGRIFDYRNYRFEPTQPARQKD